MCCKCNNNNFKKIHQNTFEIKCTFIVFTSVYLQSGFTWDIQKNKWTNYDDDKNNKCIKTGYSNWKI